MLPKSEKEFLFGIDFQSINAMMIQKQKARRVEMQKGIDEIKVNFKNPPREYGIYPILCGGIVQSHEKLEQYDRQGFAGVVGAVPYEKDFPNDEGEWDRTERAFRAYINKGMQTWIYDEDGYPSGTAGGVVIDEHPEYEAAGLYCYEYWRTLEGPMSYRADVPGDRLYKALLLPLGGGEAIDITDTLNEKNTLHFEIPVGAYHLFTMSIRRLFDGTHAAHSYAEPRDYINLLDADATRAFIKVTHENYARKLGDQFSKGVRAFFTDEPSLIAWNITAAVYPIVPWHRDFPVNFQKRYGYPVELAVTAVVTKRGPQYKKRRCDFWEFVGDTVANNYFGVIQDWCRAHNIPSSGHMLEEERLQTHVYDYGSLYKCAKRMDWPGIDQLESEPLRLMDEKNIPIARLLSSVADVYGCGESFTEFSDHFSRMENKQIGMNWIRSSVNWHYAMGINNMTSFFSFENFKDTEIRELNEYNARIGYLIRRGRRMSKVALLYPEAALWAAYTPTVEVRAMDNSEATLRVSETFPKAAWELLHRQIDFDFIDEDLIRDGVIENGALRYKNGAYECLVFPAADVLSIGTVEKIKTMLDAGIGVILIGDIPKIARETGEDAGFYEMLSPYIGRPNFTIVPIESDWTLPGASKLPALPRPVRIYPKDVRTVLTGAEGKAAIVDGEIISSSMLSHTRVLEDGSLQVFICNMGGSVYDGILEIRDGKTVMTASPDEGEFAESAAKTENGVLTTDIRLRPYESCFYLVDMK